MTMIIRRGLGRAAFALGLLFQHENSDAGPTRLALAASAGARMTGSADFAIGVGTRGGQVR